jgi:hypothetical protein
MRTGLGLILAPWLLLAWLLGGCVDVAIMGALESRNLPPDIAARREAYLACLAETAGRGRDPFDVCMLARGYAP